MAPQQAHLRLARVSSHLAAPHLAAAAAYPPTSPAQGPVASSGGGDVAQMLHVAAFEFDVTPPLGTPLMDGGVAAAAEIKTPLTARGVVLLGMADGPVVLCSVDWVSICNESHDRLRAALARGCGTEADRVALHTVHQHDAPGCDSATERLLVQHGLPGVSMVEPFLPEAAAQFEAATRAAVASGGTPVTHVGVGVAEVDRVASNRHIMVRILNICPPNALVFQRVLQNDENGQGADGLVKLQRQSSTGSNPEAVRSQATRRCLCLIVSVLTDCLWLQAAAPEGVIDRNLQVLLRSA